MLLDDKKEYAKFRLENNVNFMIFWATVFLTCFVGIIELLPEFNENILNNTKYYSFYMPNSGGYEVFLYYHLLRWLFYALSIGIFFSIRGCKRIFFEGRFFLDNEYLGKNHKEFDLLLTDIDSILLNKKLSFFITRIEHFSISFLIFLLLSKIIKYDFASFLQEIFLLIIFLYWKLEPIYDYSNYYVGNKISMKYHEKKCYQISKIDMKNIIYFTSKNRAEESGYVHCLICDG